MLLPVVPIWKQAPFIRLLPPLILGILLQWYLPASATVIWLIAGINAFLYLIFFSLRGYLLFLHQWLFGLAVMTTAFLLGITITHFKNITHHRSWFGYSYSQSSAVIAVLNEPLIEKNKTYKATATVYALSNNDSMVRTRGNIIIYFKKDSSLLAQIGFGSAVVINKRLQPIQNSGNPGAFDYKRYCLFEGITHQVYLVKGEFEISPVQSRRMFSYWLQRWRAHLIEILRRYIPGKSEAGVAEALLIGYRANLDRDLLQAYANTGVIHIIAISGMHLAMIYGLLVLLLKPLRERKESKWIWGLVVLLVLWLFALLSGAGPSILRSAVMFSFIVVGESMRRRVSVYHSLSASAFFLLCWNPFFLWDVGFQLSYAAVLSIVIFQRPVAHWFYSRQFAVNQIWKLIAVTLSAQILTFPLSIYHFHQIPNLFLISNLVTVPLSGIILYGEILLCLLSVVPVAASFLGIVLSSLLSVMNNFISLINRIPFAVSDNISTSIFQTLLFYTFIILLSTWLLKPRKLLFFGTLATLLALLSFRLAEFRANQKQNKVIVYNIPGFRAVDFIRGNQFYFVGDKEVQSDAFLHNFHLAPSRILHRVQSTPSQNHIVTDSPFYYLNNHRILLLDTIPLWTPPAQPVNVDIIVLGKNAKIPISVLQRFFRCSRYVFDGSSPRWKILQWKNECDSLHLRRHSVGEDGAFVFDF